MTIKGVGLDIIEISRMRSLLRARSHFFDRTFSTRERAYCFGYKDSASHFAGTFAAKEAASKALDPRKFPVLSLEIRRSKNGKPEVWSKGRRVRSILVSISHNRSTAIAIAIKTS